MEHDSTRPDLKVLVSPRCIACQRPDDLWGASVVATVEGEALGPALQVWACEHCVAQVPGLVAQLAHAAAIDSIARLERADPTHAGNFVCERCGERSRAALMAGLQAQRAPSTEARQVVRLELPAALDSTGLSELLERSITELSRIPVVSLSHASTWLTQAAGSMGQQSPAIGKAMLHAARIVYLIGDAMRR